MEVLTRVDPERMRALRAGGEFFWADLEAPAEADVDALGVVLGIPPLIVADTRNFGQRPKLDELGERLLLVFWSAREAPDDPERGWRPIEHHLYVSRQEVVTVRKEPWPPGAALRERVAAEPPRDPAHAVYLILRAMCDAYDPAIDDLAARLDALEALVFQRVARMDLQALYHLRQELQDLLRRAAGQRDGFGAAQAAIARLPGIDGTRPEELADIHDQLVEVAGELGRHADDVGSLIELYFSASGDRLNRLAYRLTILATFFVIATVVTSFFGQNFRYLVDSIDSERDFWAWGVGGVLAPILALAALVWWRRRDWL